MCSEPNPTGRLDLLSILIEPIADDRLGTVFVGGDSLGREGIVRGIIELFVVCPVRATIIVLEP
jgi:hypothetical protein